MDFPFPFSGDRDQTRIERRGARVVVSGLQRCNDGSPDGVAFLCSIEERTSEDMTVEQRQVASLLLKSDKILFTNFLFSQIAEDYREQIEEALVAICREILVRQFGVQLIHSIIFFFCSGVHRRNSVAESERPGDESVLPENERRLLPLHGRNCKGGRPIW